MKGMLRVPEAARRFGLHDDTIRRAIRRGELPAVRAFNRTWVREEDLETLLTPSFSPGSDQSGDVGDSLLPGSVKERQS